MPDKMSRALAAKGGLTVKIAGKECTVRPLGMRELKEVENDCLERYAQKYLKTCFTNMHLLSEKEQDGYMAARIDEAGRWDIDSLPPKYAHDDARVKVTKELRNWLLANLKMKKSADDKQVRQLTATALDQGSLSADEYARLTDGSSPLKMKVSYSNWWITSVFDGMITFIWVCFRANGVTRDEVINELGNDLGKLAEVSREIERLSSPSVGNG